MKKEQLAKMKRGDTIEFGNYTKDGSKIKEPIEWLLVKKEENKVLIISKFGIDCKPYHEKYEKTSWKKCTLRSWLNGEFYSNAFTSEEKEMIEVTEVKEETKSFLGLLNTANDKVFVLSVNEAKEYLPTDRSKQAEPTMHAMKNNAYQNTATKACFWWLRSPGVGERREALVDGEGIIDTRGDIAYSNNVAVRPAMWIKLK